MKQSKDRFYLQEDRLAQFADQVLEGKMKQPESNVDDELSDLEQTILRLNQSLPPVSLDEATVKQMAVRLNARIRREAQEIKPTIWNKWFSSPLSRQTGIIFGAVVLLILLVLVVPLFTTNGSSTATALTPINNLVVAGALVGGILFIFWVMRRK